MKHSFIHKPLRVLLVGSNFCRSNEPFDAYGVSCLASAFRRSKANVGDTLDIFTIDLNRFRDNNIDSFSIDWNHIANDIMTRVFVGGYNVVAFSVFGWFEKAVKLVGERFAKFDNTPFIMLGGPSIFGNEKELCQRFPFADMFILSYGEKVFANLWYYIKQGKICVMDPPDFSNLVSPYLSRDIVIDDAVDTIRVESRRGCPFRCSFCKHRDTLSGKVHHIGNYDRYCDELKLFKAQGVTKLNVLDPFFNDREEFGLRYLRLIREVCFDGIVSLQIRPEFLNESFVEEAAKNPGVIFEIGVQSLDSEVLKVIQRGAQKTEMQLRKALSLCRDNGIATEVTLIYGLPLQTYESLARDIDIIKSYSVGKIRAFPLQVYSGTKLADDIEKYDLTLREDDFGIFEVVDNPTHDFKKMQGLVKDINNH